MAKKKEIDRLIEKGKEKNYLTFQEIENYLDDEILNINKIEDLYDVLSKYGVIKSHQEGSFQFLDEIVEKPAEGLAPSNLVNISKYILSREIWPILDQQSVNPQSGELYITDSLQTLAQTEATLVHVPQGTYLDGGYPLGWLLANLTVAKDQPELWAEIKNFVNRA